VIGALLGRNLRHVGRLLAVLFVGVLVFEVGIIYIAASFDSGPGLARFLEMVPQIIRGLIGSQIGEASFGGFAAFGFQHPGVVVCALAFVIVAGSLPAADHERGTLDLLLARPLPRWRYLTATVAVVVVGALAIPLAAWLGCAAGLMLVTVPDAPPPTRYVPAALELTLLMLACGGVAMATAAGARRRGTAAARTAGMLTVAFVLETLAEFSSAADAVRWLSPFHYFKPVREVLVPAAGTGLRDALVLVGLFLVATGLAFARFARRDV
jgi:ABC-2 type transport system permease protein